MATALLTPKFRASYANVFKPRAVKPGDAPKYQLTGLFTDNPDVPPGSATLADLKKAALDAAFEKWGNTEDTKKRIKSGKIKMPFIKPSEDDIADGKVPQGTTLILRFNSPETSKPGVVDRFKGPDGKAAIITSEDVFYSGCYARASIRAFAYDRPDSKGVTFALNNVQKLGEGERFDGRKKATDEFEATDEAPADLEPGGTTSSDDDADPMGLDNL